MLDLVEVPKEFRGETPARVALPMPSGPLRRIVCGIRFERSFAKSVSGAAACRKRVQTRCFTILQNMLQLPPRRYRGHRRSEYGSGTECTAPSRFADPAVEFDGLFLHTIHFGFVSRRRFSPVSGSISMQTVRSGCRPWQAMLWNCITTSGRFAAASLIRQRGICETIAERTKAEAFPSGQYVHQSSGL